MYGVCSTESIHKNAELFRIHTRFQGEGVPVYAIFNLDGDMAEGTFYEPELQALNDDPSTEYQIEKILKRHVRNKQKKVLVRWLHWPKLNTRSKCERLF